MEWQLILAQPAYLAVCGALKAIVDYFSKPLTNR